MPYFPPDLAALSADYIAEQLLGGSLADNPWWKLERTDSNHLRWSDRRMDVALEASHGFIIGLHEVGTIEEAQTFAAKNKITLIQSGGLVIKSGAELAIRCSGLSPILKSEDDLFRLHFSNVRASVGHASVLFQRLILRPAAEAHMNLPDPATFTTLAMANVDRDEVTGLAELCLYYLRDRFPRSGFAFIDLPRFLHEWPTEEEEPDEPGLVERCLTTTSSEAVAFYNRALESEPLAGFLYFYRVLEACFDSVFHDEVSAWRSDSSITSADLVKRVRRLTQKEDIWALRKVLGAIVDQALLDGAESSGIIAASTADGLTEEIYGRRNEIAHGRRWQHGRVLVPFSFPLGGANQRDSEWHGLMRTLARRALEKWILR